MLLLICPAELIKDHIILNDGHIKDLSYTKELKFFVKMFITEVPVELYMKLWDFGVYSALLKELDDFDKLMRSSMNNAQITFITEYEAALKRLRILSLISRRKYRISVNKSSGIEYVGLNFYQGIKYSFNHVKRSYRILARRDEYQSLNAPELFEKAERKYFEESMKFYYELINEQH